MKYTKFLIILLILIGVLIRIIIVSNGNFIFHMDNARDMVDIREMVVLHKWRLIGPTSGIEGVFTGPLWYYIAAVPFVISGGDPLASIYLQIFFWAVGGFFLLQIVKRWGVGATLAVGGIWAASNLIILNSQHSLSPNPIILLMPLFIYLLEKYLTQGKIWLNILCWLMAGLFFQLEMAWGIFMPLVVIILSGWARKDKAVKDIILGILVFGATLLPQVVFDLRHQLLMTHSLLAYVTQSANHGGTAFGTKILGILNLYWGIYQGLFMNSRWLVFGSLAVLLFLVTTLLKRRDLPKDKVVVISLMIVLVPLMGYLLLPIKVMMWHAQAGAGAVLILLGCGLGKVGRFGKLGAIGVLAASFAVVIYSAYNLQVSYLNRGSSTNPSLLKNEISAIDYVYNQAEGKGFRVYTYMPSIIDYPYQYLIWWYGLKTYGYLPDDYSYLPGVPEYISNKNAFANIKKLESSQEVFLIEEPDTRGERHLWENSFKKLPLVTKIKIGSIEIEERKEI